MKPLNLYLDLSEEKGVWDMPWLHTASPSLSYCHCPTSAASHPFGCKDHRDIINLHLTTLIQLGEGNNGSGVYIGMMKRPIANKPGRSPICAFYFGIIFIILQNVFLLPVSSWVKTVYTDGICLLFNIWRKKIIYTKESDTIYDSWNNISSVKWREQISKSMFDTLWGVLELPLSIKFYIESSYRPPL